MNQIGFVVRARDDLGGALEVVPTVDGRELTDLIYTFERSEGMEAGTIAYGGLIPAHFAGFGPMDQHFAGATRPHAKVSLLGCDCGEVGCWPLNARVTTTDDRVVWSDFEQPHRRGRDYQRFGPFEFDRQQFDAAATALAARLADSSSR